MKKPKAKIRNCKHCGTDFLAEPYEQFKETDYDTIHEGWGYGSVCPACCERWKTDKEFRVEVLYTEGLITQAERLEMLRGQK